jgi:hypothetical protein
LFLGENKMGSMNGEYTWSDAARDAGEDCEPSFCFKCQDANRKYKNVKRIYNAGIDGDGGGTGVTYLCGDCQKERGVSRKKLDSGHTYFSY